MTDHVASSWQQALAVYRDRQMVVVLLLGCASGLPLALTLGTLTLWLADSGINKAAIGLFGLVGIPYTLKFLWAPWMDALAIPGITRKLGRRRGWLAVTQVGVILAMLAMAATDPTHNLTFTALAALFLAFFSASQDVIIDAYRVEILTPSRYAAGAGVIVLGYRLGMLISGAGALYLAQFWGWSTAYVVMASIMGLGLVTTLLVQEPPAALPVIPKVSGWSWLALVFLQPFTEFLARPGWAAILAFTLCYKLGDAMAGLMSNPLYNELGFTLVEIANVTKVFGLFATLVGGLAGGAMVARFGLMRGLLWFGLLQLFSNFMYVLLAWSGHHTPMLIATIAFENLSGGMGTAAFVAYLSQLCNRAYTASQYALLSALAALARSLLASSGGWLADFLGWPLFFSLTAMAAIPGILLVLYLARRFPVAE